MPAATTVQDTITTIVTNRAAEAAASHNVPRFTVTVTFEPDLPTGDRYDPYFYFDSYGVAPTCTIEEPITRTRIEINANGLGEARWGSQDLCSAAEFRNAFASDADLYAAESADNAWESLSNPWFALNLVTVGGNELTEDLDAINDNLRDAVRDAMTILLERTIESPDTLLLILAANHTTPD